MKIDMKELTIKQAFERYTYLIPKYQRPYSWNLDNLKDFWDDTQKNKSETYFLGSVVVYLNDEKGVENDRRRVVDGQQRLTTALVFLSALERQIRPLPNAEEIADQIDVLIQKKDIDANKHYVLESEQWSPWVERNIQRRGLKRTKLTKPDTQEGENIHTAFRFFTDRLEAIRSELENSGNINNVDEEYFKSLKEARNAILGATFVQIQLDSEEDAFVIFETLNTRGMPLSVSNLFKNVLFRAIRGHALEGGENHIWEEILENSEIPNTAYTLDNFLYRFYSSRHKHVQKKNLYPALKNLVEHNGSERAIQLFDQLHEDSKLYRELIHPDISFFNNAPQFIPVINAVKFLDMLKISSPLPFLLALYRAREAGTIKDKDFIRTIVAVENFHFLVSVSGRSAYNVTGGLNHSYSAWALAVKGAKTKTETGQILKNIRENLRAKRRGTDAIFKERFYKLLYLPPKQNTSLSAPYARYILGKIYKHLNLSVPGEPVECSLEHIIPQSEIGNSGWDKTHIGCLGNLMLVSHDLNNRIGNRPFSEKARILKQYDVPMDGVLRSAVNTGEFDASKIEERCNYLAERALIAWKIG